MVHLCPGMFLPRAGSLIIMRLAFGARNAFREGVRDAGSVTSDPSMLTQAERIALLDATLHELPPTVDGGRVQVGGEEAVLLWEATVDSFAGGVWVATILCAQATCERVLAGLVLLRELPGYGIEAPKRWQTWGLGTLIGHVREQGWVPTDLLDAVQVLCEARKPYGHFRRPFYKGTIGRQVADALVEEGWDADPMAVRQRILSEEALRSTRTTLRLYFGDYARGPFEG